MLENLGELRILVSEKAACFLLQIKLFVFLQNKNNHIKYNKEVIKFYLLSFFLVLVVRCRKFSPNLRNEFHNQFNIRMIKPCLVRFDISNTVYKTWFTLRKSNFELKFRDTEKKLGVGYCEHWNLINEGTVV